MNSEEKGAAWAGAIVASAFWIAILLAAVANAKARGREDACRVHAGPEARFVEYVGCEVNP